VPPEFDRNSIQIGFQILQTRVALERIATYLAEDEVTELASSLKRPANHHDTNQTLGIKNGNFKWNSLDTEAASKDKQKDTKKPTRKFWLWPRSKPDLETDQDADIETLSEEPAFELRDISVVFPTGKLSLVTGPTASGKTALLLALLGEMQADDATRVILPKDNSHLGPDGFYNTVSFAAQRPWLQHLTIRDNIVFGAPFEEARYEQVIVRWFLTRARPCLITTCRTHARYAQTWIGLRTVIRPRLAVSALLTSALGSV
jgi:ABC-type multidrug transport system fused ATPase/permease subunit